MTRSRLLKRFLSFLLVSGPIAGFMYNGIEPGWFRDGGTLLVALVVILLGSAVFAFLDVLTDRPRVRDTGSRGR